MSDTFSKLEVITGVARRRRFSTDLKLAIVAETMQPGMSISYVARRHGLSPSLVFRWRRLISALPVNLHLCGRGSALVSTPRTRPCRWSDASSPPSSPRPCALSEVLDAYLCTFAPHHLARTGVTDQRLEDELLRTQQGIERQE